jgi:hypothetical protein
MPHPSHDRNGPHAGKLKGRTEGIFAPTRHSSPLNFGNAALPLGWGWARNLPIVNGGSWPMAGAASIHFVAPLLTAVLRPQ